MREVDENLAIAKDAIGAVSVGSVTDGTIPEIAAWLAEIERISAHADELAAAIRLALIDRMESDDVRVPGVGWVQRRPKKASTAGSDWEGARRAAKNEIARRVAFDKATGENRRDWEFVAKEAMDLFQQVIGFTAPKQPFQTLLGLNLDDFIKTSPGGHFITINGTASDE